jgi:DNA-directed RNA polymerase specialized sigma24 family protein
MGSQCASMKPPAARRHNNPYGKTNPVGRTPSSTVSDRPSPSLPPAWKKMKRFVKRGLTTKERLLITLRYCENLTLQEIGVVLDLPASRVAEMHQNVLERVKTWVLGRKKAGARVA